jgi:hypothetical protein
MDLSLSKVPNLGQVRYLSIQFKFAFRKVSLPLGLILSIQQPTGTGRVHLRDSPRGRVQWFA